MNTEKLAFALTVIGNINFDKARSIICDGIAVRLPEIGRKTMEALEKERARPDVAHDLEDLKSLAGSQDDHLLELLNSKIRERYKQYVESYKKTIANSKIFTVDPDSNISQVQDMVLSAVVENERHYNTLRGRPSDWNNIQLFARLWAYADLVQEWSGKINGSHGATFAARSFLNDRGLKIFLFLRELRTAHPQPRELVYMLIALEKLDLLLPGVTVNKAAIHKNLSMAFDGIGLPGSDVNLRKTYADLTTNPTSTDSGIIESMKNKISEALPT